MTDEWDIPESCGAHIARMGYADTLSRERNTPSVTSPKSFSAWSRFRSWCSFHNRDRALTDYAQRHRYRLVNGKMAVGGYQNIHVWLRPK
jgi:hypothetical protein